MPEYLTQEQADQRLAEMGLSRAPVRKVAKPRSLDPFAYVNFVARVKAQYPTDKAAQDAAIDDYMKSQNDQTGQYDDIQSWQDPNTKASLELMTSTASDGSIRYLVLDSKAPGPSAASDSAAERDTVTVGGRVKKWNPVSKDFDIDLGPAGSPAPPQEKDENGRRWVWNPTLNGGKGDWVDVGPAPENPQEAARRKEAETKDNTWTEVRRRVVDNQQTGVKTVTITEVNQNGKSRDRTATEQEIKEDKPVTIAPGRLGRLIRDAEGTITGIQELAITQAPRNPNRSKFTGLSPERLAQSTTRALEHALLAVENDETIDDAEKLRRATALKDYALVTLQEQQQLLSSQQNSLTNRTTQRNQDMQDVQGRRNFAQSIFTGGMNALANAGQFSEGRPEDTAKFVEGFKGYMAMAQDALARFGGDRYVPWAVPGAEQQRLDQLSMPAIVGAQQVPAFIAPTYTSVFAPPPAQFSPMPSVQVPVSMAQPQPQPVAVPVAAPQEEDEPIGMPRFMMLG